MVTDAPGARGQRPSAVLRGKGRLAAGAAAKERTSNRGRRCGATEALRSSAGPGLTGEPGSPERLVLKYIFLVRIFRKNVCFPGGERENAVLI